MIRNRDYQKTNSTGLLATSLARIDQITQRVLVLAALIMGLALVSTYLARWGWIFETTSHFRVHIVVALLGLALLLLVARQWPLAGITALIGLIGFTSLTPFYFHSNWVGADESERTVYRALAFNVHYHNDAYDEFLTYVAEIDPDIIVLSEITQAWQVALQGLTTDYPYTHQTGFRSNSRLIFSRLPFVDDSVRQVEDEERPSAVVTLNVDGTQLTIVGVHLRPPLSAGRTAQRNQQLDNLAVFTQAESGPIMMMGDFNITPWSPVFRDFLDQAGLKDARLGHGLAPTWPTHWPIGGIPIDHIVVSPAITVHHFERGPNVGSDHYPVIVDFSLGAP
jgi:endonuclease/exonuclease/phosphatase (EEP) superfamily protein YafD